MTNKNISDDEYWDDDCSKGCKHKEKCDRLKHCFIEWEAMSAWSPNCDDPYYELNRQMAKPLDR